MEVFSTAAKNIARFRRHQKSVSTILDTRMEQGIYEGAVAMHSDLKRPDMWPILITGKPLNLYHWFWYQSNPYRQDIL